MLVTSDFVHLQDYETVRVGGGSMQYHAGRGSRWGKEDWTGTSFLVYSERMKSMEQRERIYSICWGDRAQPIVSTDYAPSGTVVRQSCGGASWTEPPWPFPVPYDPREVRSRLKQARQFCQREATERGLRLPLGWESHSRDPTTAKWSLRDHRDHPDLPARE